MRAFAFGGDDKSGQDTGPVWSQPFPVDIPSYPVGLKNMSQPRHTDLSTDIPQKIKHLPPYPPTHLYKRSSIDGSKKRGSEDQDIESMRTARRLKRIHASKNIQQSLARLDADKASVSSHSLAPSSSSAVFEGITFFC